MVEEDEGELWTVYAPLDEGPEVAWRMPVNEARRHAQRERRRIEARFRAVGFCFRVDKAVRA